jgi:hypothetical protein
MRRWLRPREEVLADQWHLVAVRELEEAGAERGFILAACGLNLGSDLEEVDGDSIVGNRCPVCQGIALEEA